MLNTISVNLGGKPRIMKYDFNAFATVQQKTGKTVSQLTRFSEMRMSDIRTLVHVGLVSNDKKITEFEVGSWVWMGNLGYVLKSVSEALVASLKPVDKPSDEGKKQDAASVPLEK